MPARSGAFSPENEWSGCACRLSTTNAWACGCRARLRGRQNRHRRASRSTVTSNNDAGADFGVLFWHKDGYSTACGHGTIALGAWAVESGRIACEPDGEAAVTIDVPSGRVVARVRCAGGAVASVTFRNVPAYVIARGVEAAGVRVDVAYGGAIYASVAARRPRARGRPRATRRADRRGEKVARPEHRDHGFPAGLGQHRQLDPARLNVHDVLALVALGEDGFPASVARDALRDARRVEERLRVEGRRVLHRAGSGFSGFSARLHAPSMTRRVSGHCAQTNTAAEWLDPRVPNRRSRTRPQGRRKHDVERSRVLPFKKLASAHDFRVVAKP